VASAIGAMAETQAVLNFCAEHRGMKRCLVEFGAGRPLQERDMSFSVSNRVAHNIRRFRNHMCDSPSEIPCLAFGHLQSEGVRGIPEFVLSAMNRRLCDIVGGCRIVHLAHMDVAVVVPKSFGLLEDVHLDYDRDRIVNIG
jgi:hypothetical protein